MNDWLSQQRNFPPCVIGTVSSRRNWEVMSVCNDCCEMLEWRVDLLLEELSAAEVESRQDLRLPVLVTVRDSEEGGKGDLSLNERREWFMKLMPVATAIDIEVANMESLSDVIRAAREKNVAVIGSAHNFEKVFDEKTLREKGDQARSLGADLVKIAHYLNEPADLLTGTEWLMENRREGRPAALMGMGKLGPVSRLLHAQAGSRLVYGYLGTSPTAPGQLPAREFSRILDQIAPLF